ncbi:MAG TPA: T9SS type A sorting domain-containing protein [Bacteroidia bacterium]|jgi:hypothetical protein|nr:T9SS type A sorting domain-containing protein [Bacteroidia bacterium]
MKTFYLLIFLAFSLGSFAQLGVLKNIEYKYDAAGNRIQKINPGSQQGGGGGGGALDPALLAVVDTVPTKDSLKKELLNDKESIAIVFGDKKNDIKEDQKDHLLPNQTINGNETSSNQDELVFTISPNPVRDQFTLTQNQAIPDLISTITIYNSQGKIVQTFSNVYTPLVISVNSYETGSYYVQVLTKTKAYFLKFIKG